MLMTKGSRRECREYERLWKGVCVDRNLEDEWMERLNALGAFALVGICEGHSDRGPGSPGRFPHINLRLRESLLPRIAGRWESLRMVVLNEVGRLFQSGDTDVRLELKFRLRAGRGRLIYQEDLTVRMRSYRVRDSAGMDRETAAWFERIVERIEELDGVVFRWHENLGD